MNGHLSRSPVALASVASILVAGVLALTSVSAVASKARGQEAQADKGAEAFTAVCSKCHPADRIVATRRTRTQWEETLEKMTKLGAQITDDNYDTLIEYLLRHYGKINVNRGASKDLALVANITRPTPTPSSNTGPTTGTSRISTRCRRFLVSTSRRSKNIAPRWISETGLPRSIV